MELLESVELESEDFVEADETLLVELRIMVELELELVELDDELDDNVLDVESVDFVELELKLLELEVDRSDCVLRELTDEGVLELSVDELLELDELELGEDQLVFNR